jgi:hypothetical protein
MRRPARTNPAHPLQGPDRVGHKHSRARRSVHKCASNRPSCSTLVARWSTASISMFLSALGLAYSSQDRHERGPIYQLLRETAVEIDPERVERLQRAHARAYQQYSVQMIGDQLVADQAGRETRRCHHVEPVRPAKSSRRRRSFLSGKFMRATSVRPTVVGSWLITPQAIRVSGVSGRIRPVVVSATVDYHCGAVGMEDRIG